MTDDLRLLRAALARRELEQEQAIVRTRWRDLPRGRAGNPLLVLRGKLYATRTAALQLRLDLKGPDGP